MKIRKVRDYALLPKYQTNGSSGLDLYAAIEKEIEIKPLSRVAIPTGISIELPEGYEAQVRSRSGLALKHGIMVLNSPGTIDSDYRGEISVILYNSDPDNSFVVHPYMRIAQLVISKYTRVELIEVNELSETERGDNGFGSTGI